jgi:4-hydroxybenzoyl-CoA thioesterase
MPHLVHHKRLRIEWGHCDPAGIVFNSRFFEYFDWSTWEMFESVLGVPRQDLFSAYEIIGVPLVDAQARFLVPVRFGDHVEVASEISEFRRSSFDVAHRITLNGETLSGELAVEGRETRVWAGRDADGRIRGKPIPEEVVGRFRAG